MKTKKSVKQATGKDYSEKAKYTNVMQILGDTGLQKFGTLEAKVYLDRLEKATDDDVRLECEKFGIKFIHNKEIAIKSLMEEFYKHSATFQPNYGRVEKPSKDKQKRMEEILKRAK